MSASSIIPPREGVQRYLAISPGFYPRERRLGSLAEAQRLVRALAASTGVTSADAAIFRIPRNSSNTWQRLYAIDKGTPAAELPWKDNTK